MIKGFIYCFISPSNKKYYGYTHDLKKRIQRHKLSAFKNNIKSYFYNALRKYSWEKFKFEIIDTIEAFNKNELKILLSEREKYWIKKDKTHLRKFGYNMTLGGDGVLGYVYPLERKNQYSKKFSGIGNPMFGKHHSSESIISNKISNLGKTHTDETKIKMSKSQTGRVHSEETKQKIRKGNKGKIRSEETRKKLSLLNSKEKHPFWGKKRSDETKRKMSESRKGKKHKIVFCPHCGKRCSPSTLSRWHNNNCKFKV